jgi:anion-transporting  ArsA/GET3 family ATPase
MMFLGHICWLTTLAEKEAGLRFDRVLVDTPAAGHGASLLDLPATLAPMHASGLLGSEMSRVDRMMRDPDWTGAIAVSLPEELAVEETLELVPRAAKSLGRPLLAVVVNRSAARLVTNEAGAGWLYAMRDHLAPAVIAGLEDVHAELRGRLELEGRLRRALEGAAAKATMTEDAFVSLDEQLGLGAGGSPRGVVAALAAALSAGDDVVGSA